MPQPFTLRTKARAPLTAWLAVGVLVLGVVLIGFSAIAPLVSGLMTEAR